MTSWCHRIKISPRIRSHIRKCSNMFNQGPRWVKMGYFSEKTLGATNHCHLKRTGSSYITLKPTNSTFWMCVLEWWLRPGGLQPLTGQVHKVAKVSREGSCGQNMKHIYQTSHLKYADCFFYLSQWFKVKAGLRIQLTVTQLNTCFGFGGDFLLFVRNLCKTKTL